LWETDNCNIKLQRLATSVRSASLSKPQVTSLRALGIDIRTSDWQTDGPEVLDQLFSGSDIVISTVNSEARLDQKLLVDAAKRADVKRFIPSDFGIPRVPSVIDVSDEVKSHFMKLLNGISDRGPWHGRYWKSESILKTQAFHTPTSTSGFGTKLPYLIEELRKAPSLNWSVSFMEMARKILRWSIESASDSLSPKSSPIREH
jgi:NmrA-like family